MHKGSCLCGAVKFEVEGSLSPPDACHCSECRKWTGHFLASTDVPRSALKVHGSDRVSWFHSSEKVITIRSRMDYQRTSIEIAWQAN